MKYSKSTILYAAILLTGCASSYKTINPESLSYLSSTDDRNFKLNYKYGVLKGKYAKKEAKKDIKLMAIKMVNNTGYDLVFGKDIQLTFTNKSEATIVDKQIIYNEFKQGSAIYLLYLLLTPTTLTTTSNGSQTSSVPIGYGLGPGIAFGNMLVASGANESFKKELEKYAVLGTIIKNGETRYGLVGVRSESFEGINVRLAEGIF